MSEIGRRDAPGLLFRAGAPLALFACSSDASTGEADRATTPSGSAAELEDNTCDLTLNLWAEPTTAEITPGDTTDVYSFGAEVIDGDPASVTPSGSYLGPTLHMRTGQRVRVTFENRLPEESIVHWHGLVVPQDQDGQPTDAVAPGATYDYDFILDKAATFVVIESEPSPGSPPDSLGAAPSFGAADAVNLSAASSPWSGRKRPLAGFGVSNPASARAGRSGHTPACSSLTPPSPSKRRTRLATLSMKNRS